MSNAQPAHLSGIFKLGDVTVHRLRYVAMRRDLQRERRVPEQIQPAGSIF
jgi:hypothetical protein